VRVSLDFSAFGRTRWYEYAVRFVFGGAITVVSGLLAKHYGPAFGGLFMAFPAIFPASATLVEKHEKEKKQRAGIFHTNRGRQAAALDAAGAAMGTIGLAVFAFIVWKLLPIWHPAVVLLCATGGWLVTSFVLWRIRRIH
jgi:hypothetical protein